MKEKKLEGNKICGYGAAAKGNTLLNYCEVKTDMIDFVCDAAQSKQNKRSASSADFLISSVCSPQTFTVSSPTIHFKKSGYSVGATTVTAHPFFLKTEAKPKDEPIASPSGFLWVTINIFD